VCDCIDSYLDRSKKRTDSQLLLSFNSPYKPISPKTVSRWITDILELSGIDTNKFKAHSTRSAASYKAKTFGVPVKEILKRGHWSNDSTFQRHYVEEVVDNNDLFQPSFLGR